MIPLGKKSGKALKIVNVFYLWLINLILGIYPLEMKILKKQEELQSHNG